ncbi:Bromodomain testis-specific protein [Fasciolopsis buskii]|uniref:Bromodomain testis-specific protein n=1 Tax=Fasciolopsis buskii TaxID=27845 RepID=A0A8E0VKU5_9TREM|nr:Bromodomain testis-specific protein [Fasciolopsis buski]
MNIGGDERRSEVALAKELFDSFMSRNLAQLTYPFMEEVDPEALGLKDYRNIVTEPMWLKRSKFRLSREPFVN